MGTRPRIEVGRREEGFGIEHNFILESQQRYVPLRGLIEKQ
jgi:hypothetical protein